MKINFIVSKLKSCKVKLSICRRTRTHDKLIVDLLFMYSSFTILTFLIDYFPLNKSHQRSSIGGADLFSSVYYFLVLIAAVFSSAVLSQYKILKMNISQQQNLDHSQSRLHRYLHDPLSQISMQQRDHKSSNKTINRMLFDDESKTQRRSYGNNKDLEDSYGNQNNENQQMRMRVLQNENDIFGRELEQTKNHLQSLEHENKQLTLKIERYQVQAQKQESKIELLQKKFDIKGSTSGQELRQLKSKLHQTETQLHEYLKDKNKILNVIQQKQKEWLDAFQERETVFNSQCKKLQKEIETKNKILNKLEREVKELRDLLKQSKEIVDQVNQSLITKDSQLVRLRKQNKQTTQRFSSFSEEVEGLRSAVDSNQKTHEKNIDDKRTIVQLNQTLQKLQADLKFHQNQQEIYIQASKALKQKLKESQVSHQALNHEKKALQVKIDSMVGHERQLQAKINRFEEESKSKVNTGKSIGKQVKNVEAELTKIKLEPEYENASKGKKLVEYQKVNELLNKKIQLLAQENIELSQKLLHLTEKYNTKDDQHFALGQQLIQSKEQLVVLDGEIEALTEQKEYLQKRVKQLEIKEQEVAHLTERIMQGQVLLEELEQRQQSRQTELLEEIKLMTYKYQEKEQDIIELNEKLQTLKENNMDLQSQIESLNYSLKNLQTELQCTKRQSTSFRRNNLQFEQKMITLQRTEANTVSSIEELHQDNLNLKLMLGENQEAITSLGLRYEALLKGTVNTVMRFHQILTQSRNIANQSVKHEKIEVSNTLNESLRFIVQERKKHNEVVSGLQQQLLAESNRNSEHTQLIKLKTQMIEQYEKEVQNSRIFAESLVDKIKILEKEILDYQAEIKEKNNEARQKKMSFEKSQKELEKTLNTKEQNIKDRLKDIEKLQNEILINAEKHKKKEEAYQKQMKSAEQEYLLKLEKMNEKYAALEQILKKQKQALRIMRQKSIELENTISKQNKQKQDSKADIQKRKQELVSVKVQSEYRYKLICQKQNEILQFKKVIDKVEKERDALERAKKNMEQGNKVLLIARNEAESAMKEKNNEMEVLKAQVTELSVSKNRLTKTKDDLLNVKKNNEQTIRQLNSNIKVLKQSLLISSSEQPKEISLSKRPKTQQSSSLDQKSILSSVSELSQQMKQKSTIQSKLLQLINKKNATNMNSYMSSFSKDLLTVLNRMKINIMTKKNLQNQHKTALLEDVKAVQVVGDRLSKCISSDIY